MKVLVSIILLVTVSSLMSQNIEDRRYIHNLQSVLESKPSIYKDFESLSQFKQLDRAMLWPKFERITGVKYGDSITTYFNVGIHNDRIFFIKVFFNSNDTTVVLDYLGNNADDWFFDKRSNDLSYLYVDKDIEMIFKNKVSNYLGSLEDISIPDPIKDDYIFLISPFDNFHFSNDYCYGNKIVTRGRKAINNIKKFGRYDLIWNICKGYNSEGRAFALEALLQNENYNDFIKEEEIKELLKKLEKTTFRIETCIGSLTNTISYFEIIKNIKTKGKAVVD